MTWCRYHEQHNPWDQWAEQTLIPLFINRQSLLTDEAWHVVLQLLQAAPDDKVLGNIGASPIEDLLSSDPENVARLIESEADNNPRLRRALAHVWRQTIPTESFDRVKRLADLPNGE